MELVSPTAERPAIVLGEAMIELAGVEAETRRLGVAGDTFNTAVHMARASIHAAYITALSEDVVSRTIEDALEALELSTDFLLRVPGGALGAILPKRALADG